MVEQEVTFTRRLAKGNFLFYIQAEENIADTFLNQITTVRME